MAKKEIVSEFGFLQLDSKSKTPLFRQLYQQIRQAILQNQLKADYRIPSSRDLMEQLRVSRTTVITAIDLLVAEGYLKTSRGRGTFVTSEIPDEQLLPDSFNTDPVFHAQQNYNYLSEYGKSLEHAEREKWYLGKPTPFCPGEPAMDQFPSDVWSKIVRRTWKTIDTGDLSYGDPAGLNELRSLIADYLKIHRGVRCEPAQVMIVNGTQQAIDIVARIILNPGDQVLIENPGYTNARETFEKQNAKVIPMPVDHQGALVSETTKKYPKAKLAYITPSHQFPMGVTMPIERRLEIVNWARENDGIILEDDYDSEYRYMQKPLPCMQGLDASSNTIYVGSFSKVVFPALGLGYAIVPMPIAAAFENALRLSSRPPSQVDQMVLSEFIREGHFVRHLRRMRKTHAQRRALFVEEVERHLSDRLEIIGSAAGLHCTTILKSKMSDIEAVNRIAEKGIVARPLSNYYMAETSSKEKKNGLVFGFACATPAQIRSKIRSIGQLL